jgi:L-ascorbate metabolism protein UlaG (beta-lactamase superfamily)
VTPLDRRSLKLNGVAIDVLRLLHAGKEFRALQHVGYVVHLAEWTLLHVGDADMSEANFKNLTLEREKIDVALVPFWF